MTIEEHYGRAMDIEWARDGVDGLLYILQARPLKRSQRYETAAAGPAAAPEPAAPTPAPSALAAPAPDTEALAAAAEG